MFKGVYCALITPFKNGNIDFDALSLLIDRQTAAGIEGFVLLGTTAETPALSFEEKKQILDFAVAKLTKEQRLLLVQAQTTRRQPLKT